MKSKLTKAQKKQCRVDTTDSKGLVTYIARIRYDDECNNKHNTFSITCDEYRIYNAVRGEAYVYRGKQRLYLVSCGCQHELVRKQFPHLASLIKWHLMSSDGPLYYLENTIYWTEQAVDPFDGNDSNYPSYLRNKNISSKDCLECARSVAVWPEASIWQLHDKQTLLNRLPELIKEFKQDIEDFGFVF